MTYYAVSLVLLSAFFHASWNYLIKRSDKPEINTFLLSFAGGLIAIPFAVFEVISTGIPSNAWIYILATVIIHTFYFLFMGKGYKNADLSTVYPIARGFGVGLTPFIAVFFISEKINFLAGFGIFMIFMGVITVGITSIEIKKLKTSKSLKGVIYALLTGCCISLYSVVDKQAVQFVSPAILLFFLQFVGASGMYIFSGIRRDSVNILSIGVKNYRTVIAGGLFQFLAYFLVLNAYEIGQVSYIAPLREVGIVIGAILAYFLLKEKITRIKSLGVLLILVGAVIISSLS